MDINIKKLIKNNAVKEVSIYQISHLDLLISLIVSNMKPQFITKGIGLEHPTVKSVIEIAEEILSKNKVLNVETLYNMAKKRLKIPKNGLLLIIQLLINKKILIEGSKFSKETVLLNRVRNRIYRFIRMNPGVHFSILRKMALSEEAGSSGQLVWHLEMLLKFNYIKKIKVGNYSVFLPIEIDDESGKIYYVLQNEIYRKIINYIISNDSQERSQIYNSLGEDRGSIYYRIQNLIDFQILESLADTKVKLNPKKREIVMQVLNKISNNRKYS